MLAFVVVVGIGVAVGYARGGKIGNAQGARFALLPLVWFAAGLQVGAQFVPSGASMVAYGMVVVSYAALFSFAGANWRMPGMAFIALGAASNYLVILLNQGMPIAADAAARAGFVGEQAQRLVLRGKHFIADGGATTLRPLGDIIPLWRQPAVASVGDLVIWSGMILLVQDLLRTNRRKTRARNTVVDVRDLAVDLTDTEPSPETLELLARIENPEPRP